MPALRAVIFDCYGTLIDVLTNEAKEAIFSHLSLYLRYYGINIDPASLKTLFYSEKEQYMNTNQERYPEFDISAVFTSILQMRGQNNPFLVESCCKLFRLVSRDRLQLFSDSLPVLKELRKRGYPMAMASNAQDVFFYAETEMLGIRQFFSYFVVSSHWGFRKPDPRIFSLACSLLNTPPEEAVYIGDDTAVDVKGARQIGMKTVLIDREKRQKDREPRPDLYISSLNAFPEWLSREGS